MKLAQVKLPLIIFKIHMAEKIFAPFFVVCGLDVIIFSSISDDRFEWGENTC